MLIKQLAICNTRLANGNRLWRKLFYFIGILAISQEINNEKMDLKASKADCKPGKSLFGFASGSLRCRVSVRYRVIAGLVFALALVFFVYMSMGARGLVEIGPEYGMCGFEQSYGLPCPGCFWTRSTVAFVEGRVWDSLYLQPAAFVFCVGIAISGVFSLLSAVLGIRFPLLDRPLGVIMKYLILGVVIVVLGGWAVTLARALSVKG